MAEKYLYPTDELSNLGNQESSTDLTEHLPGTVGETGFQGNPAVGDLPRRATELYGGRKVEMSKQLKMSNGKRIDYIIVYQLPEDLKNRAELDSRLAQPPTSEEPKWVRNARKRMLFEHGLQKIGVLLEKEKSADGRTIFIKLHAPFEILINSADEIKLRMPLSEEENKERQEMLSFGDKLTEMLKWDNLKQKFQWMNIFDTGIPPDEDYYSAVFRKDKRQEFQRYDDEEHFFTDSQRALLVNHILNSIKYAKKDDQVGIRRLINNGSFTDCYPLHDGKFSPPQGEERKTRALLFDKWARFRVFYKMQPHDLIRAYFGEKVAVYFVWLGFYTRALIFPSFIGILIFFYGLGTFQNQTDAKELCESKIRMCPLCDSCDLWNLNESCAAYKFSWIFDNGGTIAFAFIMSLWASIFLDFWKRKNAEIAYDWDMMDYHDEEPDRPQFKSKKTRINPVTGQTEKYYPAKVRYMKYLGSVATIAFMLGLVIMVVVTIILYRLAVRLAMFKSSGDPNSTIRKSSGIVSSITASVLNLITIMILNRIYGKLAVKLTDWENHRKESDYESNLAFKIFLFQFVNMYSSLFYIAFFKGQNTGRPGDYNKFFGFRQDECAEYGCLLELTIQLSIIMVGKQTINNFQEVCVPMVKSWLSRRKAKKNPNINVKELLPWEEEFVNLEMYPSMGMFYEYLEMIIQYGFVTLFVAAFPLGPLFALLNNILEIRIDANKLVTGTRRPPASPAANIGVWEGILQVVSILSVVTNGLVIAVTSSYITKRVYESRTGSMVGFVYATHPMSPLSPNDTDVDTRYVGCSYTSLRDEDGVKGGFFYEVWASRLGFLILFEHIVFVLKFIIQYVIPDIPKAIVTKMKREAYLAKQALEGTLDLDGDGQADYPKRKNGANGAAAEDEHPTAGPSFTELYGADDDENDDDMENNE